MMLKKYALFSLLVMVAAWSTMAFSSVSYVPKQNSGMAIVEPGDELNFRIAHMWNGIFIPSVDVNGMLLPPASSVAASEVSQQYQYGPALLSTGFAAPAKARSQGFQQYQYGPALLATGFAAPAAPSLQEVLSIRQLENYYRFGFVRPGAISLPAPHFYQYGPAILATGFASPAK